MLIYTLLNGSVYFTSAKFESCWDITKKKRSHKGCKPSFWYNRLVMSLQKPWWNSYILSIVDSYPDFIFSCNATFLPQRAFKMSTPDVRRKGFPSQTVRMFVNTLMYLLLSSLRQNSSDAAALNPSITHSSQRIQ